MNGLVQTDVPLVDLKIQLAPLKDEIRAGWDEVMESGALVLSDVVRMFEQELARFMSIAHAVGVGSGTDALELAFRVAGIGPGDEVIVPTNTFVATPFARARRPCLWTSTRSICWSAQTKSRPRSRIGPGRSRPCVSSGKWRRWPESRASHADTTW